MKDDEHFGADRGRAEPTSVGVVFVLVCLYVRVCEYVTVFVCSCMYQTTSTPTAQTNKQTVRGGQFGAHVKL